MKQLEDVYDTRLIDTIKIIISFIYLFNNVSVIEMLSGLHIKVPGLQSKYMYLYIDYQCHGSANDVIYALLDCPGVWGLHCPLHKTDWFPGLF